MSENAAKRVIKKGSEFEKYFKPFCNTTFLGYGNTDLSIKIMAKWVKKYKHQTKQLALDHFAGYNLLDTVNKIYQFAHDHFQYKLDGADQQIRSPYCAWLDRYNGIDCKSYSVIVGTILDNLGINYYFKKTKQPGYSPDQFTHVYVSIPKNQKTNSLEDYYIIDATIHNNIELPYLEAKTKLMSSKGLKHYGLGKPALGNPNPFDQLDNPYSIPAPNFGLAGSEVENNFPVLGDNGSSQSDNSGFFNQIGDFFKDLDFNNLFASIDCIGGTAFNDDVLKDLIPKITNYYLSLIEDYNEAIANKDWTNVHKINKTIRLKRHTMVKVYDAKRSSKNWNSCSNKSFEFVYNFLDKKIYKVLFKAFNTHLSTYFNVGASNKTVKFTQPAHSGDWFDGVQLWGTAIPNSLTYKFTYSEDVTPKTEQIPAFIVTPEIKAALNSDVKTSSFNVNSFMQTLGNTAPLIYNTITGNNGNPIGGNNIPDVVVNDEEDEPQKAGLSFLQIGVLAGLVIGGIKMSKSKKSKK